MTGGACILESLAKISQPLNTGSIIAIQGTVVDVAFCGALPPVHTLLRTGEQGKVLLEVLTHLESNKIRGIALTPPGGGSIAACPFMIWDPPYRLLSAKIFCRGCSMFLASRLMRKGRP